MPSRRSPSALAAARASGKRSAKRIGSKDKRQPCAPQAVFAISDGRTACGAVEVVGGIYIAVDTAGIVIGTFASMQAAMRALPPPERSA
jgi:hypothetical protein